MIAKLRQYWNSNRRPFLMKINNLIINRNPLKSGASISISLSTMIHMIWCGFVFVILQKQQGAWKTAINSGCSKIRWQQKINGIAREFQRRRLYIGHQILPHPYDFSLPDIIIDLSYLCRHKITHPDLCLIPLFFVYILHSCADG